MRNALAFATLLAATAFAAVPRVQRGNLVTEGIPEIPAEISERLVRELRAIGYQHVTIDLQGYRMGSLNEGVRLDPI